MKSTQLLVVTFDTRIAENEILSFRGAIVNHFGNNINKLFHNHLENGLRHSYPLVQYKCIKGHAVIWGIDEGVDAISQLAIGNNVACQLGSRKVNLTVKSIFSDRISIYLSETTYRYKIERWLPLNSENYKVYQSKVSLVERIHMLEKILIGNILSFAKGIGLYFDKPIICNLINLENTGTILYKGVELMSFDAIFQINVVLPDFVGIGKSASVNCGVITCYNKTID